MSSEKDVQDKILPLNRWPTYTRKIPYGAVKTGYMVNPENPLELIPNVEHIYWIEQAFDYLANGSSLREVAEWLGQKIHKAIVHQTLNNLYNKHRKPFTFRKTEKKVGPKNSRETRKLISEKLKAKAAVKRALKLEEEIKKRKKKLQPEDFDQPRKEEVKKFSDEFADLEVRETVNYLFRPNPGPQTRFLQATELEVLYGGSAGGEPKSWFTASFHSNVSK